MWLLAFWKQRPGSSIPTSFEWIEKMRFFITAKWAMSLDGKIATHTGQSQWISSKISRAHAHRMRSLADGVVTGIGTVFADDPLLTVRYVEGKNPTRIVVDLYARIPLTSKFVSVD